MASLSMTFKMLGQDISASKAFKGVGKAADGVGKRVQGMGVLGSLSLAAVGVAALKFGSDSVKAYSEAEEAQKRLGFAFKKFPALADSSQGALQKLNSEWQKKTKFDDDNIASGQAVLAQFKLTGRQLETVTPLLLDYASATGKDLPTAAKDLGKALMGNVKALKNIGIAYKSTGDPAQDFANVTQLMRDKVGGFAEEEGKTAAGQLAILGNQFGEVQETVGGALVPALTSLTGVALPLVETLGKIPGPVLATGIAVTTLGAAVVLAVPKIVAFRVAMSTAGVTSKTVGRSVKGAGKAIGALVVATAAAAAIDSFSKSAVNGGKSSDDLAKSIDTLGRGAIDEVGIGFTTFTGRAAGLNEALGLVRDNHWWDQLEGGLATVLGTTANFTLAKEAIASTDEALASLVAGGKGQDAALAFSKLADQAIAAGVSVDELTAMLPQFASAQSAATKPVTAATIELRKQGDAIKTVDNAFKVLQGILDKGAATDAWITALKNVGKQAKESGGQILGSKDAAIKLRDQVRADVGALSAYAESFKNPAKKAEVLKDGLLKIRESLIKGGVKKADVDQFLAPLSQAASDGYTKAKRIGAAINGGLVAGLSDRAATIAEATQLGRAAVQAVRRGAEVASPSKYTTWVGKEIANGVALGVTSGIPKAVAAAAEMAKKVLEKTKAALSELKRQRNDMAHSTAESLRAGSTFSQLLSDGGDTPVTGDSIRGGFRGFAAKMKGFAGLIVKLRGMGLSPGLLSQIVNLGPGEGIGVAKALIDSGSAGISELNGLQGSLDASAGQIGNTVANATFGAKITKAQSEADRARLASSLFDGPTTIVKLVMPNGKVLAETLIDYRRQRGAPLGLG